jgi:hypothetical protein
MKIGRSYGALLVTVAIFAVSCGSDDPAAEGASARYCCAIASFCSTCPFQCSEQLRTIRDSGDDGVCKSTIATGSYSCYPNDGREDNYYTPGEDGVAACL